MDLTSVRALFLDASGRHDLVNSDGTDNGADKFINAGQRYLDTRINTPKSEMRRIETLAIGQTLLIVEDLRAIKEVWMANTDGRFKLDRESLTGFRARYPNLVEDLDQSLVPPLATTSSNTGKPKYWAETVIGLAPEQNAAFLDPDNALDLDNNGFQYDHYDISEGDHYNYRGILFGPAIDKAYTVNIFGFFFSRTLAQEWDKSYWTMRWPYILVEAAMYRLEVFYRNNDGAALYQRNIDNELKGIDHDLVEDTNDPDRASSEMAG